MRQLGSWLRLGRGTVPVATLRYENSDVVSAPVKVLGAAHHGVEFTIDATDWVDQIPSLTIEYFTLLNPEWRQLIFIERCHAPNGPASDQPNILPARITVTQEELDAASGISGWPETRTVRLRLGVRQAMWLGPIAGRAL